MQRNRKIEKSLPKKNNIQTKDINVSINIGNDEHEDQISDSYNEINRETKPQKKVLNENKKNLDSLIFNLKSLISTFSDKKKQVLNMKIDIPNDIFDLPDISIDSEEDIMRLTSVINNKIAQLNILLSQKKSIPLDIPRQPVYNRAPMPAPNFSYSNAYPFASQRLPPQFQKPVSYEDYINANRKPPTKINPEPETEPETPAEEPITPSVPTTPDPPETPQVPDPQVPDPEPDSDYDSDDGTGSPEGGGGDFDEGGDTVDPNATNEEPQPNLNYAEFSEKLNNRLIILESFKQDIVRTFFDDGTPRSNNAYTILVNQFNNIENLTKQASQMSAEGKLTQQEFDNVMIYLPSFPMFNSNGSYEAAKAYTTLTTRPLTANDSIDLVPIAIDDPQQKEGAMRMYRVRKNGNFLEFAVNGSYGGKYFNKNGDRYNVQDSNTKIGGRNDSEMPTGPSNEEEFPDDARIAPDFSGGNSIWDRFFSDDLR